MLRPSPTRDMKSCPNCNTSYPGGEVFCPLDGSRLGGTDEAPVTHTPPSADPLVGALLQGRYRIIRRIGEGGMGIVYEAEHVLIEKRVALKVLRDDFSNRPDVVERFRQEAKSASRIGHENIVDISDFGETPSGASYFVMEFLQGRDLAHVLTAQGTLDSERALRILLQCCRALGAAHHKGIVHRDMKPENIFLTERDGNSDFVKIVDFGIAKMSDVETAGAPGRKLTKTGMIFGTPEYMSPEQAAGKQLDHRVDIYAIGVILFEVVTGRVPFVGDTFMGILTQHMFGVPPSLREVNPNVQVSPNLESVIYKALSKDANDRFQSMEEIVRAIAEELGDVTLTRGATSGGIAPASVRGTPETHAGFGGKPETPVLRGPRVLDPQAVSTDEFPLHGQPGAPAKSGGRGMLFGGVGIVGLCGVAAAVWFSSSPDSNGTTPLANATDTSLSKVVVPQAPTAQPALGQPGTVADAGSGSVAVVGGKVQLLVKTDPASAFVFIEDKLACGPTPCSFFTDRGVPVTIRAKSGNLQGVNQVLPTQDAQEVEILLGRFGSAPSGRRAEQAANTGTTSASPGGPATNVPPSPEPEPPADPPTRVSDHLEKLHAVPDLYR